MGWEVRSGFHIATDGPVPDTGDINIITTGYPNGKPVPLPSELRPSDEFARWRGYSLDMHGQPALDAEHPREPVWRPLASDGPLSRPIELVRIRVQPAGCDLFAELIVLPIEGQPIRVGLFGWDAHTPRRIPPPAEIEKAIHGLELLGLVRDEIEAARGPGQPPRYDDANELQFFKNLEKAAHEAVRKGRRVNFTSLADYGLASRPVVTRAVKLYSYDLDAVYREAVACTQGANTCTFLWRHRDKFKQKRQ
jgi:hypothetical protein